MLIKITSEESSLVVGREYDLHPRAATTLVNAGQAEAIVGEKSQAKARAAIFVRAKAKAGYKDKLAADAKAKEEVAAQAREDKRLADKAAADAIAAAEKEAIDAAEAAAIENLELGPLSADEKEDLADLLEKHTAKSGPNEGELKVDTPKDVVTEIENLQARALLPDEDDE